MSSEQWNFKSAYVDIYEHIHSKYHLNFIQTFPLEYFIYVNKVFLVGAHGVMVIVAGIGHGDSSSNPGLIAFHIALIPLGKV